MSARLINLRVLGVHVYGFLKLNAHALSIGLAIKCGVINRFENVVQSLLNVCLDGV